MLDSICCSEPVTRSTTDPSLLKQVFMFGIFSYWPVRLHAVSCQSRGKGNDQEPIQSNSTSCPDTKRERNVYSQDDIKLKTAKGQLFPSRWQTVNIKTLQALHDTPPLRLFLLLHMFWHKHINVPTRFDKIHQVFHKILSINIILKSIKGNNSVEKFGKIMCISHNLDHICQCINKILSKSIHYCLRD